MRYRWICLRLLLLLVLLLGGLGALRAEVSEPDSLSAERVERIGAFDREKLERSFGLVRFRSSAQARYALDLGEVIGKLRVVSYPEQSNKFCLIPIDVKNSLSTIITIEKYR